MTHHHRPRKRRLLSAVPIQHNINTSNHMRRLLSLSSTSTTTIPTTPGLFSIPELQTPSDFATLTQQAIQKCNTIRTALAVKVSEAQHNNSETSSILNEAVAVVTSSEEASYVLCQLDDISKIVCNIIDAAELCRSVHTNDIWRNCAHEAFIQLSDYLSILNADTTLYDVSRLVSNTQKSSSSINNNIWNTLCEEEHRFVQLLQAEFVRDGIHLSHDRREKVRNLQHEITLIESEFLYNITNSRQLFTIQDPNSIQAVTEILPLHILEQNGGFVNRVGEGTTPATTKTLSIQIGNTNTQILQTLLKYSSDGDLRKQIYYESMTSVSENIPVLQELIQIRHELAKLQKFHSYAERNLLDKMIGTSNDVLKFLALALQQNLKPFQNDMTLLSQAKQQLEGNNQVEPWDINYYVGMIKAKYYEDLNHNVSQYLSVGNCINAMQQLVQELFGINMEEAPMSALEQWDVPDTSSSSSSSSSLSTKLRKYQFTGPDAQPLGTMYLDLHPRDNKYSHAAHFTVRCGCEKTPNIRNSLNDMTLTHDNDLYQYPIIALVCNLSDSTTLSHNEVETLFHEFGHALHSLLSRTKFQHLSGTRAALDFVETPSNLFENFVWDTQFLQILGRHHITGEIMPLNLIQQLQKSRYQLASIERQNQILYSLFDQKLFGTLDASNISAIQIFGDLHQKLCVPYAKDTHWFTRFGHLVSYGGGYYAYLYSQVFARNIWTRCFQERSLDRTAGNQLWYKLLRYGGAKDPHEILTDLLGRSPEVKFTP